MDPLPASIGGGVNGVTWPVEFAVLMLDPKTKQPKAKIYRPSEIDALLLSEGLMKKDEDTEMKSV